MKKLVLTLLLSIVAVNAFGMEAAKIAKYQYRFETEKLAYESKLAMQKLANEYEFTKQQKSEAFLKAIGYTLGAIAITWVGAIAIPPMWDKYLNYLEKNTQNSQAANNSPKINWSAYAKIAAGVGLTGLTAYLGMKQSTQPQSMEINYSASGSGDVGNTFSPNIMLNFSSAYTLAPMVPAYFFLKSGFKDLKTK